MADKEPVTKSRTGRTTAGRGRRLALGGGALLVGALAALVAHRCGDAPALGAVAPRRPPVHSPVIALGAIGLVGYTMFFLVCEAALLVLAIINIQDEKLHHKYRSLMLLVVYVFTFRYRRVLPAKFFAEDGSAAAKSAPGAGGSRKAGKHRRRAAMRSQSPSPPQSPPVTDEEFRAACTILLTRMATALGNREPAAGRAVADIRSHPHE
jgi:hypothetical protein